ncbi:MAG: T9SS type A sorting domain-containing protein [Candidatus Marinimicrobia bacterium]|nr:T9SS type A sorting domain-containing protein [Candidatus Neomarinimicrobiota bacterium]
MKKIILLLILICFVSFASAYEHAHRYATWQADEDPSINEGESVTFSVEWGKGGWDAGGSKVGYGTSTDGTSWTWVDIDWIEDGEGSNKRCSTSVTFNTAGTYYYAFRYITGGTEQFCHGYADWAEMVGTLAATNFVTVAEVPLPITLTSFVANTNKGSVELVWETATETENSHFLIYRDDAVIGQVEGNGTCTDPHDYTFVDDKVKPGIHEYAISDVTYGGEEVLHEAVSVEVGADIAEVDFVMNAAYPNPFNPTTVISMHYAVGSNAIVNIYNTQGVLVEELVNDFVEAGNYELTWDASGMPSGVYIVKMHAGNVMQSQKIVLMK